YIRIDFRSVAEEVGLPLIGVAADESIEIVEAHANRPLIKWTRLARRERRSVVVLAEPRRRVTVILQNSPNRCLVFRDDAVVARITGGLFRNNAETNGVMVAAGDQCGARGRAKRGGIEVGIAQSRVRDAVQSGRGDNPAKRAGYTETRIVGHDQQNVWRALGRHDSRIPAPLRFARIALDHATDWPGFRRQLLLRL